MARHWVGQKCRIKALNPQWMQVDNWEVTIVKLNAMVTNGRVYHQIDRGPADVKIPMSEPQGLIPIYDGDTKTEFDESIFKPKEKEHDVSGVHDCADV